jgi:nucleoid DNA-binding protein
MKASELRNLIREEISKTINEASNPFAEKINAIYTKIEALNNQIDKIVDQAIKSVTLEVQGNKAIFTRSSDGAQFITTKSSTSRSERTVKNVKTGKVWGITRNMTLEKMKFAIAIDNPGANPDY